MFDVKIGSLYFICTWMIIYHTSNRDDKKDNKSIGHCRTNYTEYAQRVFFL